MPTQFALRAVISAALATLLTMVSTPVRAEHCWRYVDGVDPVTHQVNFPGFEFTKAPFQCVRQDTLAPPCSWNHGQPCNVGSSCCTSIPEPASQQHILDMHSEWHTCFGVVGQIPGDIDAFPGRSARWLAFHRQFEFDFDLMREARFGCGPGRCVSGACSNNTAVTCTTDVDCDAHEGCFIEALDWHTNMTFPYGHFGNMLQPNQHPANCGTGPNRPDNIICSACRPLPACLYNAGAGPLNGDPPTAPTAANCLGFQGSSLDQLPSLEVVAKILDSSHHGDFHGEVGNPFAGGCTTNADCQALVGSPCVPATGDLCPICMRGRCEYSEDVFNSACSPRDPMFWRLHKRLDDTVRAWQEKRPFDLSVVIDRSGSMSETDSSGRTKIQVATEALRMLADLLPDGTSNRVAVASYSTDVTSDMPLTSASDARTAIQAVADGLEARVGGCTSIGSGLEAGVGQICHGASIDPGPSLGKASCNPNHGQLPAGGENERKGILLLTDGMENRPPCLHSASAAVPAVCGDTCGGGQFDFSLLGAETQLCAIGFGQAQSVNGNLLTLVAERQGGIYMQSPAKGPSDLDGQNGTGRFVDLKDFFVKCFGQLSDEFVGIDPKGTLASDEFSTFPVPYSTCDDEKLTFVAGWNASATGGLRLMVNAPSGALVRANDPSVESSGQDKWAFIRAPLPLHGELAGTWTSQLIRPHNSYVNGFTTDSLPSDVSLPLVRKQIQRICPTGCASVLYFEDGRRGAQSSYEDALAAERATGLVGSLTTATDANDFNAKLTSGTAWNLIVYAHQMSENAEPYDLTLLGDVCGGFQPIIVTETRGLQNLTSTPAPGDPNFVPFFINSCAGGAPTGDLNFTEIIGDGRLLVGQHTLTNNGYATFSYAHVPFTLGGGTQAFAGTGESTTGAISAQTILPCDGEFCFDPPAEEWFVDVLVRGRSALDDVATRFTYRTGESGIIAGARVLPANVPIGGYDQTVVKVEVERPTVGVGRTLLNVGHQPSGATSTADGPDGRAAALLATRPIATTTQTLDLNDDGVDGDLLPKNGYWSRAIEDSDTPGQCLVDGMYKLHFTADFTKNGCTTRRELVRSTFVDVGVDPRVSNLVTTPVTGGMRVDFCPRDRCGNPAGWGRRITCGPDPACTCGPSDIVDRGDGCYSVTVHAAPSATSCTIDGTGKPVDVTVPVTADAGPDQVLQCTGGGATAQLDGSGSHAASGTITFLWSAPGITFSNPTVARPTARFPVGTTTVTLRVTSSAGLSVTDTVQITVVDTTPPVLVIPPDITISTCNSPNIGTATATDGCGGTVTLTNNKPTRFPLGVTLVTYFAVDRFGNAVSKTQQVKAVLGDDVSCCPAGTNIIRGTSNNDVLNGTNGSDCILGFGGQDTLNGNGGNDYLSGGEGDDILNGGAGDDQLFGGNGQDQLNGGPGRDILDGGGGDDICRGGDDDDIIRGGDGQDKLFGENGNDQLFGEAGDDRLEGGPGNDQLNGGGLHDVCIGGTGTNTFTLCETQQ